MNIYLDDERETPPGFVRTYGVKSTIELIKANNGEINILSLDNDLGPGYEEGRKVLDWIEEQAFNNTLKPIPHILIHTGNPGARDIMMRARYNAWQYWIKHGYKREDYIKVNL